jgi:1-acyl-sn-glycerol-3-phosphate acyltransferase
MTNKRYVDLKVTPGTYVPPVTTDYPEENPYEGLYKPVYDRDFPAVDATYPYVDDTWQNKLRIWYGYYFVLRLLGLILRIKYGLRFVGLENVRKYRKQLAGGAITISNHCYRHDCASVLYGIGAKANTRIPMFAPNFRTKDQFYLCIVGGIPIPAPEEGLSAMKAFNAAFDEFHRRGYWFHIFPEAKRWDWYKPLRPFQKGAFTMSYKYNMPIVPCAIVYRPRTGIYKWFGPKDEPLTCVVYGEPIFPNTAAPRAVETERLLNKTHETICRLAGITHNTWPSSL